MTLARIKKEAKLIIDYGMFVISAVIEKIQGINVWDPVYLDSRRSPLEFKG